MIAYAIGPVKWFHTQFLAFQRIMKKPKRWLRLSALNQRPKLCKTQFKEWKIIKFSYDTSVFENNGQNQAQTRIRVSSFKKENDFIIQYWYTLTKANSKKIILECIMQLYYQSTLPYSTEMIKPHIGQSYREFLKNMTKIESNLSSKGVSFPLPIEQEFINTVIS